MCRLSRNAKGPWFFSIHCDKIKVAVLLSRVDFRLALLGLEYILAVMFSPLFSAGHCVDQDESSSSPSCSLPAELSSEMFGSTFSESYFVPI